MFRHGPLGSSRACRKSEAVSTNDGFFAQFLKIGSPMPAIRSFYLYPKTFSGPYRAKKTAVEVLWGRDMLICKTTDIFIYRSGYLCKEQR